MSQGVQQVGNSIVRSEESEMVGNGPLRSEKVRENKSDLPTIRFCRNLLCRQTIPSKLWHAGLAISATKSQS